MTLLTEPDLYADEWGPQTEPPAIFQSYEVDCLWRRQERQLLELRRLRDNWDWEGARAPDPRVVDSAVDLLRHLQQCASTPPPSRTVASPDGVIVIEWQLPDEYVSVEISEPYHGTWMSHQPGGRARHWSETWRRRSLPAASASLWISD